MNTAPPQPAHHRDPIQAPWGLPAVLVGLLLPVIIWASSLAVSATGGAEEELTDQQIISGLIVTIIFLDGLLIAIPAAIVLIRYRLGWSSLGFRRFDPQTWWWPLAATLASYIGVIVYGLIATAIAGEAPDQDLDDLFNSRAVLPLTAFSTLVAAPFAEETFFRGFVFGGLLRPLGLWPAMIASGLVFGLFHVQDAETAGLIVPFAAIGAVFAWLYYRSGSLWISIATHFLFNLVSFVILAGSAS